MFEGLGVYQSPGAVMAERWIDGPEYTVAMLGDDALHRGADPLVEEDQRITEGGLAQEADDGRGDLLRVAVGKLARQVVRAEPVEVDRRPDPVYRGVGRQSAGGAFFSVMRLSQPARETTTPMGMLTARTCTP